MLVSTILMVMNLQATAETAVAIPDPDPETWVLEYPRLIQPYVQDYHRCLNYADRRLTGEANFEIQHRSDLPRCDKVAQQAMADANAVLRSRKRNTETPPAEVARIFATVGNIHIARGRDLDEQFVRRIENYPSPLPQESLDASNP